MKQSTILNLTMAGCVIGLLAGCASIEITNCERPHLGSTAPNLI